MNDYPQGDGKKKCPFCGGRGVVDVPAERRPKWLITPVTEPCECVVERMTYENMERAWKGLSQAAPVAKSRLNSLVDKDAWVTTSTVAMRAHLHRVALGKSYNWFFKVVSDADLMTAWLGSISLKGGEIFDADAAVSSKYAALVDLVEPASLLIIQLGVKSARNSAMPEVLLETVRHRVYLNKPTWVFDQPVSPLTFGHLAYSPALEAEVSAPNFTRLSLGVDPTVVHQHVAPPPRPKAPVVVEQDEEDDEEEAPPPPRRQVRRDPPMTDPNGYDPPPAPSAPSGRDPLAMLNRAASREDKASKKFTKGRFGK